MLNAVLAALHLLNIREELFLFFFDWTWESVLLFGRFWVFWVDLSVKVAPQKIHLGCGCRDPPLALHLPAASSFGWSLRMLKGFLFGFFLAWTYTQTGRIKKVQDSTVHDHSFVHGTMMALESVLLWCLSVFFFLFVFLFCFLFGFLKKLIDLSVQCWLFFVCLFISVNDNFTEPIKKKK